MIKRFNNLSPMIKGSILIMIALLVFTLAFLAMTREYSFTTRGAGTNIDPVDHWAWNDVIGWIDFYSTGNVAVDSAGLSGYASSSAGLIFLDCATPPSSCSPVSYKVYNDGNGKLTGSAWNDNYGWISFCGGNSTSTCPGTSTYQVSIDGGTGVFSGYAWNDVIGWIYFNCQNLWDGNCGSTKPDFKVVTTWLAAATTAWLESATFDTGVTGGAQINSIMWRGNLPPSTAVFFQLAASNSSAGPWNYDWDSPNSTTSPAVDHNTPLTIRNYYLGANQRYFRYKIFLQSDPSRQSSPRVDEVIINWSR